MHDTKKKKNI